MPNLNFVFLKGNLTDKPELSYTPQGVPVANASIAVNERFFNAKKEKVERVGFFNITIWNKLAESCAERLEKGQEVIIEGRLRFEKWLDKEQQSHNKVYIIVSSIYFGRKSTHSAEKDESPKETPPPAENQDEPEEDIPFEKCGVIPLS